MSTLMTELFSAPLHFLPHWPPPNPDPGEESVSTVYSQMFHLENVCMYVNYTWTYIHMYILYRYVYTHPYTYAPVRIQT